MLEEFLSKNRDSLIERCRSKVLTRRAPRATEHELVHGIPLFLDQLITALRVEQATSVVGSRATSTANASSASEIGRSAAKHGNEMLRGEFTVGQVVHDYGDLCQAITEVAMEQNAAVSVGEFRTLNRCLDDAIADAVTEFGRQRDEYASDESRAMNQRLGFLAHELRNLAGNAILAVAVIKKGQVGLGGATGALLDRSLFALRDLVDRTLVDVRLTAGISERRERIAVADLLADAQVAPALEAAARDLEFIVAPVKSDLEIEGARHILAAALANVLQNAVKFTRPRGRISLTASAPDDRVLITVEDECGGLAAGSVEQMFRPFAQLNEDRKGLGLGLPISRRGVEANGGTLSVRDRPGLGCVFTIDLPRVAPLSA